MKIEIDELLFITITADEGDALTQLDIEAPLNYNVRLKGIALEQISVSSNIGWD